MKRLSSIDGACATTEQQPYFFTPSTMKFVLMSVATFGFYELYWFYKNWVLIKKRTNQNLLPFWRAFFANLWAFSCFKHINLAAEKKGISAQPSIELLALAYFALSAMSQLPDPYWLICILSFAPIVPVNTVALAINQKIEAKNYENSTFSTWNWLGLAGGGLLIVFAIIGAFLPEEQHQTLRPTGTVQKQTSLAFNKHGRSGTLFVPGISNASAQILGNGGTVVRSTRLQG